MSRVGDRYLRISNDDDDKNRNHKVVDCGGGLESDNFTSKSLKGLFTRAIFGATLSTSFSFVKE